MQAVLGEHKESTEEWQEDNPVLFYNFLSIVYNLQSNSTLNQYDTLDTNAIDGMLHQTLADMEHDFDKTNKFTEKYRLYIMWKRSGVSKFDEMKAKEKIVFNHIHMNSLVLRVEVVIWMW